MRKINLFSRASGKTTYYNAETIKCMKRMDKGQTVAFLCDDGVVKIFELVEVNDAKTLRGNKPGSIITMLGCTEELK